MNTITFNALRRIKDALPEGSMQKMADLLNTSPDYVRNYFGGNHAAASSVGIHYEQGPDGGVVTFDDSTLLDLARMILNKNCIKY